jgi:3-oxoacyl-(acyl-carrier-protein) synthase
LSRPVVVTGLGTVGATGCGREGLAAALAAGCPRLTAVDRSAGYHRGCRCAAGAAGSRLAALVPPEATAPWVAPLEARRMSPPSKLAVAACRMALEDAGLGRGWTSPADLLTAVVVATAYGPSSYTERLLEQILLDSPESASPFLFTESVANAPAAQIAIATRARGAGVTVAQREAGPLLAVARAAAEVANGRAEIAFAGTVEEMTPLLHAVLDRFGALATADASGEEAARPFDRRRGGFLAAEGATVLVLEAEEAAHQRGARVLARLRGWGSAFDPSAPPTGWGEGHAALGAALRRCLARAGVAPGDVGAIVSGASGSRAGDRLEALTLGAAWPGPLPPVLAPKGVTGEYGGGFLAAAVLAMEDRRAGRAPGPTAGFAEPDPALGVVPHRGGALAGPPAGQTAVLVSSLAAGGAAAWLVLDAPAAPKPGPSPGKVAR